MTDKGLNCLRIGCKTLQVLQFFMRLYAKFPTCRPVYRAMRNPLSMSRGVRLEGEYWVGGFGG
jgi:hypothetical protein